MALISIDIETKDPDLKTRGAGVRRGDGHICGIAIASEAKPRGIYYSLTHPESENTDWNTLQRVLSDHARLCTGVVGANLIYDLDWIEEEFGVTFYHVPWYDVQVAEPLIDEETTYGLGDLGERYLGTGKNEDALYRFCAEHFGGNPTRRAQAKNIWRCPSRIVAPYAEEDAALALAVWKKQREVLREEGLWEIFDLERRLQPILLRMKRRGVRIDEEHLAALRRKFAADRDGLLHELGDVNIWAAASIAEAFDGAGVAYPRTEKGNPSFTRQFLESCQWPTAQKIVKARRLDKLIGTFLDNAISKNLVRGRLHCQFNQLRGDEYGTVTGRLSQIEPRLVLTYAANLRGAMDMINAYADNPDLDCYDGMMKTMPPWLDRNAVKAIYLGSIYGMGIDKLADQMNVAREEAERAYWAFHDSAPYLRQLAKMVTRLAETKGRVRTIGGRYRRFKDTRFAYKGLNAVIQGGAADIMKRALVTGVEEGLELPLLTVHDELDFSLLDKGQALWWRGIMEEVYSDQLKVQMRVDPEMGPSWGEVEKVQ